MKKPLLFCLLVGSFLTQPALALRTMYGVPTELSISTSHPGATGMAFMFDVAVQNISNVNQTVTVRVSNQMVIGQLRLPSPSGLGATWSNPAANTWWATSRARPDQIDTKVIGPGGSRIFRFGVQCGFGRVNGLISCTPPPFPGSGNLGGFTTDCGAPTPLPNVCPCDNSMTNNICGVNGSYSYSLRVEIAEDVGAIIATVFARPWFAGWAKESEKDAYNIALNGGRPF